MEELLKEKGLWVVSFVCFLAMVSGIPFYEMELPLASGSFLKFYQMAVSSKLILFLLPIASVLPAGASYVREASSGFLKLYISRIDRMRYIKRKTMLVFISGFLPLFLAGFFVLLLCFLCMYPLELKGSMERGVIWESVSILLRISLIGGILAEISGIFSAVFQNYYMAYGLPFVCYYMLIILKERYLPEMYAMYPAEWIVPKENWGVEKEGIWMFFLAFSVAVMLLHGLLLYARLKEIT